MKDKYYIILLFLLVIYTLYNQKCIREDMADTLSVDQSVIDAINKVYGADVQAIRNLSAVATQLQAGGLTIAGDLKITGKIIIGDPTSGTVINSSTSSIVPSGTVVSYYSTIAPTGWALCDGTGTPPTPDLRGRFILGMGAGTNLTTRTLKETGGLESISMTSSMVAPHNHRLSMSPEYSRGDLVMHPYTVYDFINYDTGKNGPVHLYNNKGYGANSFSNILVPGINDYGFANTITTGNGTVANPFVDVKQIPLPIMPPYYVLTYIIKL